MSIKLGTKNIILPFSKAYLGSNLVYQKSGGYEDTEFTSSITPTVWEEVTKGTEYTATNEYGEWRIWASESRVSASEYVCKAFDGNDNSYWGNNSLSSKQTPYYIGIDLPEKYSICPKTVRIISDRQGNKEHYSKLLGWNDNTNEWEELVTLNNIKNETEETYDINVDSFYNKFQLELYLNSTSYLINIYEFQITSGTLRKEN